MVYRYLLLFALINKVLPIFEDHYVELEQKKDAVYRDATTACLTEFINKLIKNGSFITTTQVHVRSYPQFEIAQRVIKYLHEQSTSNKWVWENTNGTRKAFQSFEECIEHCHGPPRKQRIKYHNNQLKQTQYYLIFLDSYNELINVLERLENTYAYAINAIYILIYGKMLKNFSAARSAAMGLMYNRKHYQTFVIAPENLTSIEAVGIQMYPLPDAEGPKVCGTRPATLNIGTCNNGVLNLNPIWTHKRTRSLNCIQRVQMMAIPPMVINTTEGIEPEILRAIGNKLNISYTYTVQETAMSWGRKTENITNCTDTEGCSKWSGNLRNIDLDPFLIGVGRVTVTPERSLHFGFAMTYYMEEMVWVVPVAPLIPAYATIITIFEWPTWATLFSLIILMGLLTFIYAKMCGNSEYTYLHSLSAAMVVSVQIFLVAVVATQPRSNPVRCLFISYAMFMIIVGSVYQSSLINVLTNPRYEHQIDTEDEVFESGIGIGGLTERKAIFDSVSHRDQRIFNNYEIYDEVNDTEYLWLLTVAKDQDTITILGQHYAQYYIDRKEEYIVDRHGRPMVHIIKGNPLYTEQVSIVFSSTFKLKAAYDEVISNLIEAGLITRWRKMYSAANVKHKHKSQNSNITESNTGDDFQDEDEEEDDDHSHTVVITLEHLQGAFAVYLMGHVAGAVAFVFENIYFRVRTYYARIRNEKAKSNWRRLARFKRMQAWEERILSSNKRKNKYPKLRFIQQRTPFI